jgi:hypothetical protein
MDKVLAILGVLLLLSLCLGVPVPSGCAPPCQETWSPVDQRVWCPYQTRSELVTVQGKVYLHCTCPKKGE